MAVILCQKEATFPYYYERLDISVYSLEELCYAVGKYPLLIPEHFVDHRLLEWVSTGLNRPMLSEKLKQLKDMGEREERLLFRLLRECSYFTERELEDFSLELRRIQALSEPERKERMGDSFFSSKKYRKALDAYQDAYHLEENGRRLRKIAESYLYLKQFQRAGDAFAKLYRKNQDKAALRRLYFLSQITFPKDRYKELWQGVEEDLVKEWQAEWEDALKEAEQAEGILELKNAYNEGEEAFFQEAEKKLEAWKEEIRGRA